MEFFHTRSLLLLRLSLGLVFLWIGVLKLFNVSPEIVIIQKAFPLLAHFQLFTFLIAIVEIFIGVALLSNRIVKFAAIVMLFSLIIVSVPVFFTQGFNPRFPTLSLAGEYVLKNLAIMASGLILIAEKSEKVVNKEKVENKLSKPSKN